MAIEYNQGIYDFQSITIHNERLPFTPVIEIKYPQKFNYQVVKGGIGNPAIAERSVGVARGRFEGDFSMKMLKGDWDLLRSLYITERRGIFTPKPSIFTVTYKEQLDKIIAIDIIYVVFSEAEYENVDNEGGKPIEVSIKGFQTQPAECTYNGIPLAGMPVV